EIEVVGPEPDDAATQRLEGVRQQYQLAGGVDVTSLPPRGVPGVADLDAIDRGDDVVEACASRNRARRQIADRPGEHVAGPLAGQGVGDVGLGLRRLRNEGIPELPETAVGS